MSLANAQFLEKCASDIDKGRTLTETQISKLADLGQKIQSSICILTANHAKAKKALGPGHSHGIRVTADQEAKKG